MMKLEVVMNNVSGERRIAFVTGGSGFVGAQLIQALVTNNWEVRALARSPVAVAQVKALGAIPMHGNMEDRQSLQEAIAGCEVVFHVAAMFKLWGNIKDFEKVNVEGMRSIVEISIATESVKKLVAVSAAAVVMGDPVPMKDIDESVPVQMRDFAPYSASKARAEEILLAANGQRSGFETISIRPPMIWGAGMPMLDQMVATVRAGQWQWVDNGTQATSICHVRNLIEALQLAAESGHGGQSYFVTDAESGTLKSVIGGFLETRNIKVPDKSVPFGVAWLLAGIMGVVWRLFGLKGEPPITRQMLRLIGKPFTLRIDKARNELGYKPIVSWEQGISEMNIKF